mgnify:CR=1 FL=1
MKFHDQKATKLFVEIITELNEAQLVEFTKLLKLIYVTKSTTDDKVDSFKITVTDIKAVLKKING